ncbi:Hypothetical protein PHPALM_7079 [Phytophthora palmivora]|uniref:Uncharacterized protein n=1 Tax=Phytophthora palmivora TaxID=4796 RepID=A0A2P4YDI9_9STRA|nr:Hypothetical protein PHPALM_7079 [Phytophthora palmivora]
MSSTQASPVNDRYFPSLNGRNFIIWKTRVTAALVDVLLQLTLPLFTGKEARALAILIVRRKEGGSKLLTQLSPGSRSVQARLAAVHVVKRSTDGSSGGFAGDDGDVDMSHEKPSMPQSFTAEMCSQFHLVYPSVGLDRSSGDLALVFGRRVQEDPCDLAISQNHFTTQRQQELDRAEKIKAKSQQLSSKTLRLMESKTQAFLIKTIDDQHVLMVMENTTAHDIYQTLCSKYEGAAVHGDPHYIQS